MDCRHSTEKFRGEWVKRGCVAHMLVIFAPVLCEGGDLIAVEPNPRTREAIVKVFQAENCIKMRCPKARGWWMKI